jgi:hypothetical protein
MQKLFLYFLPVLRIRIRDPSPFDRDKKIKIRIRDEYFGSYFRELRNNILGYITVLKFFDADANSDPRIFLTLDPGSGMEKIRIRDLGYTALYIVPGVNMDHLQRLLFLLIPPPVFFPVLRILFPICRRGSRNKGGFHYGKNEGKMNVPNHHGQFKFAPEEFAQLSPHHEG